MEDLSMTAVSISIGDIIATLLYLLFVILIISLVLVTFKRLKSSAKQNQIINRKLDAILQKLEEQNKN